MTAPGGSGTSPVSCLAVASVTVLSPLMLVPPIDVQAATKLTQHEARKSPINFMEDTCLFVLLKRRWNADVEHAEL
jgi:hypothetical protein